MRNPTHVRSHEDELGHGGDGGEGGDGGDGGDPERGKSAESASKKLSLPCLSSAQLSSAHISSDPLRLLSQSRSSQQSSGISHQALVIRLLSLVPIPSPHARWIENTFR